MTSKVEQEQKPRRVRFKDLSPEEQAERRRVIRHSAAHVMAEAVLKLFPDAKLNARPADSRRFLLRL